MYLPRSYPSRLPPWLPRGFPVASSARGYPAATAWLPSLALRLLLSYSVLHTTTPRLPGDFLVCCSVETLRLPRVLPG